MGFFSEMQGAAAEAQSILAQMSGTADPDARNVLFAGQTTPLLGVYGMPRVTWLPLVGGGFRKRTDVELSMTREQFTTAPQPQGKLTRTDITPAVIYNIDHVNTQDPLRYILTLVNFAA